MKPKRLSLPLLLASFFFNVGNAATIIVTSNADNGPGTLREAITTANTNGTAVYDTILFNLADVSVAGRTIVIQSSLPTLTSKMIVDGTSQPGMKFGASDAKIKLQHYGFDTFSQGLILFNSSYIEIYGLYFSDFRYGDPNLVEIRCAIYVPGQTKNIIIGAAGKGNLFYNNVIGIANRYSWGSNPGERFTDVDIRGNFFGLHEDGITVDPTMWWAMVIRSFRNISIGGSNVGDGNYFANLRDESVSLMADSSENNGFVNIINNQFGSNFLKTLPVKCGGLKIRGDNSTYNNTYADAEISVIKNSFNNPSYFGSNSCFNLLEINNIRGFIAIKGNKMGTLSNLFACQTTAIGIWNCKDGIIGGPAADDMNEITLNYWQGIHLNNDSNLTISKNSLYCNSKGIQATSNKVAIPEVKIMGENGYNLVSGTASPNCKIEVFQTPNCNGCDNGKIYMGETYSDNNGNWSFTGPYTSAVTATATTMNGVTGEFAVPKFIQTYTYQNPTCGQNNGSITGTQFISGTKYYWIKNSTTTTDTIFNQLDLFNLGPGIYQFVVEQTQYCKKSYSVVLTNGIPVINEPFPNVVNPSCGQTNGSISNIYISGPYNQLFWINENRDTVGRNTNLLNAGPGRYKLIILNTSYDCGDSTAFFDLVNQAGPNLQINNVQLTPATCGNANGSISGITSTNVTDVPFIQWLDSLNNPVGSTLDLMNIPAGKYKLKFKDRSGCDTIITPFYTIQGLGIINIDTSQITVTTSQCAYASGTITGINVQGATGYQWLNASGQTVSNSLVPGFVYSGAYMLIVTNQYGCTKQSDSVQVPTYPYLSYTTSLQVQERAGRCDSLNGYVNLLNFPNPQNYTFRWIDSLQPNITISNSLNLSDINSGTFILYVKDATGCEQQALSTFLPYQPPPIITGPGIITNEVCHNQSGSILGLNVSTGTGISPFTYAWIDANNSVVSNQQNLTNVSSGDYILVVKDNIGCRDTSNLLQIKNSIFQLNGPKYDDEYIRINTIATLTVLNPQQGTYLLFDSPVATVPIQQNNTGLFTTTAVSADKTFYIQLVNGNCGSSKTAVKVHVYDKTNVFVPSGFTPNNDGKNDILKVKAYGNVTLEYFRIYNKWGQLVFSTKEISKGWNGMVNGMPQSTTVFVWMVRVKDEVTGEYIQKNGTVTLIR